MVLVDNESEQFKAILKVLESKQINVSSKSVGYDIGYMAFFVYVDVALTEADEAMQVLRKAGFAVLTTNTLQSPILKSDHAKKDVAICRN
jgi:hypothetical protein